MICENNVNTYHLMKMDPILYDRVSKEKMYFAFKIMNHEIS
jgi:hypothetical protein